MPAIRELGHKTTHSGIRAQAWSLFRACHKRACESFSQASPLRKDSNSNNKMALSSYLAVMCSAMGPGEGLRSLCDSSQRFPMSSSMPHEIWERVGYTLSTSRVETEDEASFTEIILSYSETILEVQLVPDLKKYWHLQLASNFSGKKNSSGSISWITAG